MADRITRATLEGTAETLTTLMRRASIITARERVVVDGAYGGWKFAVTGVTIEDGTGHRTGVAGLRHNYDTARLTWESASAVIGALHAVHMARIEDGTAYREYNDDTAAGAL